MIGFSHKLAQPRWRAVFAALGGGLLVICLATAGRAWEFKPGLPCVLDHKSPDAEIALTYDPAKPLYSVTVRRAVPWPDAALFVMRFDGPDGLTISTDRHFLSADGLSVTVVDTGFGNVLNGLQFNKTATAVLGDAAAVFSLAGASGPVAAFRLCRAAPGV